MPRRVNFEKARVAEDFKERMATLIHRGWGFDPYALAEEILFLKKHFNQKLKPEQMVKMVSTIMRGRLKVLLLHLEEQLTFLEKSKK